MAKKLGKYEVLEEIGRGGMAVVYRARQESLDRIVAIKELDLSRTSPDPKALERFQLEARAAASLDHPSIITVHDFWERSNKAYIAMEFVDGLELKEALAITGTVGPLTATRADKSPAATSCAVAITPASGVTTRRINSQPMIRVSAPAKVKLPLVGPSTLAAPLSCVSMVRL